jgi:enterochelin esterase-like enzyme
MKQHPHSSVAITRQVCALFSLLFLLSSAVLAAPDPNFSDLPAGQIVHVKIFTTMLRPVRSQDYERDIEIYLPAAYVNDKTRAMRFPVAYLLHGSPGSPTDFTDHGRWQLYLEKTAKADDFLPPILVSPNGNYTAAAFGDSEWLNSADGENRFEDFIVTQVVPWVDQHYRTIATAQGRIIGGVSEGGYGAVNIALHAPSVFGNILALSGYYNNDGSGWARKTMGHNKDFIAYNSPLWFINSPAANAKFLSQWQLQHYFIASGLDENRYTTESAEMVDALRAHNISAHLCQVAGKHSWELWNTLFVDGIANLYSPEPPISAADPIQTKSGPQ